MSDKPTAEQGQRALVDHATETGHVIREKYGPEIDYPDLLNLLADRDCVRYPTQVEFSTTLEDGMFAEAVPCGDSPADGYIIQVHESFAKSPDQVVAMVLYHLVAVNYGDFASREEAEAFGAACLGMTPDAYYGLMCQCADSLDATGSDTGASGCGSCA